MAGVEASKGRSAPLERIKWIREGYPPVCVTHTTRLRVSKWYPAPPLSSKRLGMRVPSHP